MVNALLSDALMTGFRATDSEHQLQINLLAALRQSVIEGRSNEAVDELLDRFVDFSKVHFASEVTLMRLYQYSHLEAHAQEHDRALEQLEALQNDWRAGRLRLTFDRMDMLSGRIQDHIATSDRAFGRYLVRLGVGPG